MFDVMTFGEGMLRLSTHDFERLEQASTCFMDFGGAEANVAVGVSRLGLSSSWVSVLPDSKLGLSARNKLRMAGVDTSFVRYSPKGRMGLYFVEFGANPRRTTVLYDRKASSISLMEEDDFDFSSILNTRAFHVTGITPALGKGCALATKKAMKAAKENGATVFFDVNYRKKLWTTQEARSTIEPLMEYVDVLITTEEDSNEVFGVAGGDYGDVASRLRDKFRFKVVAITIRGDQSVLRNTWTSIKGDIAESLKIGNAFAALKHSNRTDFNWSSLEEVLSLLGNSSSRVER
jgi:2-dehydro-3-deoxygluconokinase